MKNMIYQETKEIIDHETGEVKSTMKLTSIKHEAEPSYIKLYLSDICKLNDIPKTGNDVLNELLPLVNYDNEIILNSTLKKRIYEKIGIKKGSLDNNIYKLTKQGILSRVGSGTYMLNPSIFGRGKWQDIKKLRITWEYSSKGREQLAVETDEREQLEMDFSEGAA